jgi:hypothetical protein
MGKRKDKSVVHLRNRALEFIKEIENGFNGVSFFELEISDPKDPEDDDIGPEVAEAIDRDYVYITVGADFDEFSSDNDYCEFDGSRFVYDFTKFAKEFFGPVDYQGFDKWGGDGEIEIYRTCPEWEKWKEDNGH